MITIPFQESPTEFSVFVCLKDENIDRIKSYDPAEISADKFGPYSKLRLKTVIVGYVTDDEERQLLRADKRDIPQLLKQLSRGFKFKPEHGDMDGPYQRLREN